MTYTKKAQVMLTDEQYKTLEDLSAQSHKKLGTLIRDAVNKVYIEKHKKAEKADAVNRLLSLPPQPVPENYSEWEDEYSEQKGSANQ